LKEIREFQKLEHSFTELADNGDWMANNPNKTVHREDAPNNLKLTGEEGHILRCRCFGYHAVEHASDKAAEGAFRNASSVGELLQTGAFKQQMARFLHKHKNAVLAPSKGARAKPRVLQKPRHLHCRPLASPGSRNAALLQSGCNGSQRVTAARL
jgi:hypothetical protein